MHVGLFFDEQINGALSSYVHLDIINFPPLNRDKNETNAGEDAVSYAYSFEHDKMYQVYHGNLVCRDIIEQSCSEISLSPCRSWLSSGWLFKGKINILNI